MGHSTNTTLLTCRIIENLTWDEDIKHLSEKVSKNTNPLRSHRKHLNSFSARQFYFQFLFDSYFIIGIQVYFNICPGNTVINDLFLQHETALRIAANTHYIHVI